ncbi:MAG TPA: Gfo/Idh/MocA family oxidoreductase [Chloroflexota bacterium]|jgi:predicted dehydrogenase|nr:Gfo/Idh/MocA family oxidoreductase [Chloroflexota bacterium]
MKQLNIGLVGAGFVGKLHALAQAAMPMFFWPAPAMPVRKMIAEATEDLAREAALRFGFERHTADWRKLVEDPAIQVVAIATPNDQHAEIAIAAAAAGKHILCEKPLGRDAAEAKRMLDAVERAGVVNMVGHQFRRTPAVAFARKLIDEGAIGRILSCRGTYLQDFGADPDVPLLWRFRKSVAGSGALGDIGSHALDMLRYLVGEVAAVHAVARTYVHERPLPQPGQTTIPIPGSAPRRDAPTGRVDVDDEVLAMLRFTNGAVGSLEASRNAFGRLNFLTFEIHGDRGALCFNYERRDELQVFFADDPVDRRGFRTVYTGPAHPYGEYWPIAGIGIGYGDTKVMEYYDFVKAVAEGTAVSPSFRDGYRIAQVCDAILESADRRSWVELPS